MIAGACSALGAEMRVMQEGRRAIDKPEVWLTQQRGGRRGRGCEKLDPGTTMACSPCPFYVQSIQYPKRRVLLEKRLSFGKSKRRPPLLEPASAEFIAALAAGINSHHTLQVGCGLSTVALAVAAQTTGSCVLSVHHEKDKQKIVQYFLKELGLLEFVEFITEDSASFIAHREGVEFVLLSGIPERYIELFDLLKLRKGAVVVADNALDDATNDYIRHVRRQPGVESSTLPLNRGIEVTKIVCWEKFKRERKIYSGIDDPINDLDDLSRQPGMQGVSSNMPLSSSGPSFSHTNADTVSSLNSGHRAHSVLVQSKQCNPMVTLESGSKRPGVPHGLDGSESRKPLTGTLHESEIPETSQQGELWRFKGCNQGEATGLDTSELGKLDRPENKVGSEETIWNSQVASPSSSDQRGQHLGLDSFPIVDSIGNQLSANSTAHLDPCTDNLDTHFPSQGLASWLEGEGASSFIDTTTSITSGLEISDKAGSYSPARGECSAGPSCKPSGGDENEGVAQMDLENNEVSLPSSNCSFEEQVAPDPLESAVVECSNEEHTNDSSSQSNFRVYFKNDTLQTEVTVEGIDQDMLLFDISLGFNETGVSVQKAKIGTQDNVVSDVFYVVDVGTKAPLLESRWEAVRNRLLARISERHQLLHASPL